jgi:D-ribose pyranase
MGHNDTLTIVKAGYPIPANTQRINLALEPGVPGFLQTIQEIISQACFGLLTPYYK